MRIAAKLRQTPELRKGSVEIMRETVDYASVVGDGIAP
jgi:hypothetical protein